MQPTHTPDPVLIVSNINTTTQQHQHNNNRVNNKATSMMTFRSISFLFLIVFICSSAIDAEGRISGKNNNGNNSNDDNDADQKNTTAASKLNSFIQSAASGGSLCDHIRPDELPSECDCREPGPYSLIIECLKTFNSTYFNDTIGMKIDIDPCNTDGSKVSIDVTEKDHNIDYPITGIRAGESKNIPIPGLSIIVPTIGHVGIDAAVLIAGNPDKLTLKIGLNACAQLTSHQLCASSIPGISNILPWYVLSGTYSFGDICGSKSNNNNNNEENDEGDKTKPFKLQAGVVE
jgi:hypothetical protein